MAQLTPQLVPCEPPRAPQLVLGHGAAARALAGRLLQLADTELAAMSCAAGEGWLVARGPSEHLPWVEGVVYLASFAEAPELYVPTWQRPNLPPHLVMRGLQRSQPGPLAWLRHAGEDVLIPLASLRRPGRRRLASLCVEPPE